MQQNILQELLKFAERKIRVRREQAVTIAAGKLFQTYDELPSPGVKPKEYVFGSLYISRQCCEASS